MGILFDDISLCLFDVVTDVPGLQCIAVPSYQPHLKDNKSIYHIYDPINFFPLSLNLHK